MPPACGKSNSCPIVSSLFCCNAEKTKKEREWMAKHGSDILTKQKATQPDAKQIEPYTVWQHEKPAQACRPHHIVMLVNGVWGCGWPPDQFWGFIFAASTDGTYKYYSLLTIRLNRYYIQ